MTKPTKWPVHPVKTQTAMSNKSLLPTWKRFSFKATHNVHSEDSDQNGWMPGLIWAIAGHTYHLSQLMRFWYLSHRWPAKAQAAFAVRTHEVWKQTKGPTKNQTSSLTGWLSMRVWRMSLRKTESAIILSHEMAHFIFFLIAPTQTKNKGHKGLYIIRTVCSKLSLITRKPVFGVCDQGRLKPACAATEVS